MKRRTAKRALHARFYVQTRVQTFGAGDWFRVYPAVWILPFNRKTKGLQKPNRLRGHAPFPDIREKSSIDGT